MRAIQVSTETFAAIWADRRPGEESEDAILRRNFGLTTSQTSEPRPSHEPRPAIPLYGGYVDRRYGVHFVEEFEIFRNYKGTDYRARVTGGRWLLTNTHELYDTLNALSAAIGASENAWLNWWYRDELGAEKLIDNLRDKAKVSRRRKRM